MDGGSSKTVPKRSGPGTWMRWIWPAPDGSLLACQRVKTLEFLKPDTRVIREIPTSQLFEITCVAWSSDGKVIAIGGKDRRIEIRDRDGVLVAMLRGHRGALTALAFTPDGRTLVIGGETGEVFLWDVASGLLLYPMRAHSGCVLDLAFSPDGTRLISAGASKGAVPWNNPRAWWERHALLNGGKEQEIRGEVFLWHAPRP